MPWTEYMYKIFKLILCIVGCHTCMAQKESNAITDTMQSNNTHIATDSSEITTIPHISPITPKKKAMFSAIVPGLGQMYNNHYWKLPIVYGGLGVAGYFIYSNTVEYNKYRKIYAGRLSGKQEYIETEAHYNNNQIKLLQDNARQNRDLTVMLTVVGYGLQIIDALVFAHLKGFDISEDISMQFKPTLTPSPIHYYKPSIGLGVVVKFK
jgi:hypothetical protein